MTSDRAERIETLISLAKQFQPVPPEVATKPYGEEHRVPGCESEAFIWAQREESDRIRFFFAVENPQGISAMALARILDQGLSGESSAAIQGISDEIVLEIFGRELSMGKQMGLMGMVRMVKALAARPDVRPSASF